MRVIDVQKIDLVSPKTYHEWFQKLMFYKIVRHESRSTSICTFILMGLLKLSTSQISTLCCTYTRNFVL